MNITEAKKYLKENGVHELNKGETLADAIRSIEQNTSRKGYKYKNDDGSLMTDNQIIMNENKEAFARSFTPPEYRLQVNDDIENAEDVREDKTAQGAVENCNYCGKSIFIEADQGSLDSGYLCCNDSSCRSAQIMNLCM